MKLNEIMNTDMQTLVDEYAGLLWNENDAMDTYGSDELWSRAKSRMKEIVASVSNAYGKDVAKEFKARARARAREADKLFMKFVTVGDDGYENHPVVQWAYRWQE